MVNTDSVIFCDEDADGLTSARIMHHGVTTAFPEGIHTIIWQSWNVFGMREEDVNRILSLKPATVYILDLGSGLDMLQVAKLLLGNGINVVILDNHPPDVEVENSQYMQEYDTTLADLRTKFPITLKGSDLPYFYYHSTTENCTAGISYTFCKTFGYSVEGMDKWALIGLKGDVASESVEGGPLFNELIEKHPHFKGLLTTKAKQGYDWGIIDLYAQLLHVPRRMIFDDAPPVVYEAMKEMESMSWIELHGLDNKEDTTSSLFENKKNLATKALLDMHIRWRKDHSKVEDWKKNTRLDFPDYGIMIVKHEWNLGSALSAKLAGQEGKTWFVVNDIPKYGIHVSGRGGKNGKLHIGKVFRLCNPAIMEGGGLRPAGSANAHVTNTEVVVDELIRAIEASKV